MSLMLMMLLECCPRMTTHACTHTHTHTYIPVYRCATNTNTEIECGAHAHTHTHAPAVEASDNNILLHGLQAFCTIDDRSVGAVFVGDVASIGPLEIGARDETSQNRCTGGGVHWCQLGVS